MTAIKGTMSLSTLVPQVLPASSLISSSWVKSFTQENLEKYLPPTIAVKVGTVPTSSSSTSAVPLPPLFMYSSADYSSNSSSALSSLPPLLLNPRFSTSTTSMSPSQLLSSCASQKASSPSSSSFFYYTAPLTSAPLISLLRALLPSWRSLSLSPPDASSRLLPSLWIGGVGTCTQVHYDVLDNVLTNVRGRKRVRLWPPSAFPSWLPFPDADPRARKAMRTLEELAASDPPCLDVVLSGGGGVSIPAFWFHHCEVLTDVDEEIPGVSVSVNVFAPSRVTSASSHLLSVLLSSSLFPPSSAARSSFIGAVRQLSTALGIAPEAGEGYLRLLHSRYDMLLPPSPASRVLDREPEDPCPPFPQELLQALGDFRELLSGLPSEAEGEAIKGIVFSHCVEILAVKRLEGGRDYERIRTLIGNAVSNRKNALPSY